MLSFNINSHSFYLSVLIAGIGIMNLTDASECQALLADKCFGDVAKNFNCHTGFVSLGSECFGKGARDLCNALDDALNCTLEIVDSTCDLERTTFDSWFKGFRSVQQRLCLQDLSLIQNLIDYPLCWNPGKFFSCTEEKASITHVTDLLNKPLDAAECNQVMVDVALCNAEAEFTYSYNCKGKGTAVVVMHALTSFFAGSSCTSRITNELIAQQCQSQARISAAVASMVTLVTVSLTFGIVVLVLMRRRIVTVEKRFRFYNEDDKEILHSSNDS